MLWNDYMLMNSNRQVLVKVQKLHQKCSLPRLTDVRNVRSTPYENFKKGAKIPTCMTPFQGAREPELLIATSNSKRNTASREFRHSYTVTLVPWYTATLVPRYQTARC
jgi:hypothetical protein